MSVPQTVAAVPRAGQLYVYCAPIQGRYWAALARHSLPAVTVAGATPGSTGVPPTNTYEPWKAVKLELVMRLRFVPVYEPASGRISIVTVPPPASEIRPAWTAAVQTELSSV